MPTQTSTGVFYCVAHHGICNEDQTQCDLFDSSDEDKPCDFRECFIDPHLDARVTREPVKEKAKIWYAQ